MQNNYGPLAPTQSIDVQQAVKQTPTAITKPKAPTLSQPIKTVVNGSTKPKKMITKDKMARMMKQAEADGVDTMKFYKTMIDNGYEIEKDAPSGFFQEVGAKLKQRGQDIKRNITSDATSKDVDLTQRQSFGDAVKGTFRDAGNKGLQALQVGGDILGGAMDIAMEGGEALLEEYTDIVLSNEEQEEIKRFAKQQGEQAMTMPVPQKAMKILQAGGEELARLNEKYPETMQTIGALANIADVATLGLGTKATKQGVKAGLKQAGETIPGVKVPTLSNTRNNISTGLKESALSDVSQALAPTKKKMKQMTERISPEFLEKGIRGSRESMLKLAKENSKKFGSKIGEAIDEGILDDVKIPRASVDKILHEAKLTTMVDNAVVNKTKYKVIEDLQDVMRQFPEEVGGKEARKIKQILDEMVYSTKGGIGAEDLSYKNFLYKDVADTLRSELSRASPDLAKLNKEFSFYRSLEKILQETVTRQKPQSGLLRKGAAMLFGGQQDGVVNRLVGYIGSKVFLDATSGATWKTLSAKAKNKLANTLATGDAIKINAVVRQINSENGTNIPEMKALPAPTAQAVSPQGLVQNPTPIVPAPTTPLKRQVTELGGAKRPGTSGIKAKEAPITPKVVEQKTTTASKGLQSNNVPPKKAKNTIGDTRTKKLTPKVDKQKSSSTIEGTLDSKTKMYNAPDSINIESVKKSPKAIADLKSKGYTGIYNKKGSYTFPDNIKAESAELTAKKVVESSTKKKLKEPMVIYRGKEKGEKGFLIEKPTKASTSGGNNYGISATTEKSIASDFAMGKGKGEVIEITINPGTRVLEWKNKDGFLDDLSIKETKKLAKDYDVVIDYGNKYGEAEVRILNESVISKPNKPSLGKATSKTADLATEAKKYKSADEFVGNTDYSKAKTGKPVVVKGYHGTTDGRFLDEFDPNKKGYYPDAPEFDATDNRDFEEYYGKIKQGFSSTSPSGQKGVFFTNKKSVANTYTKKPSLTRNNIPMVAEREIVLYNPKVIDKKGAKRHATDREVQQAINEGYDGIIIKNVRDNYNPTQVQEIADNVVVFDAKNIKTESQLRKIREEANKPKGLKPKK